MMLTIGGWIIYIFMVIGIAGLCLLMRYLMSESLYEYKKEEQEKRYKINNAIIFSVGLVGCILLLCVFNWYYTDTESGRRKLKTQDSNINKGIERDVRVYDFEGDLIEEYTGKFDIEYNEVRILFDDENGKRHIIFYPAGGTVIIDEVK